MSDMLEDRAFDYLITACQRAQARQSTRSDTASTPKPPKTGNEDASGGFVGRTARSGW